MIGYTTMECDVPALSLIQSNWHTLSVLAKCHSSASPVIKGQRLTASVCMLARVAQDMVQYCMFCQMLREYWKQRPSKMSPGIIQHRTDLLLDIGSHFGNLRFDTETMCLPRHPLPWGRRDTPGLKTFFPNATRKFVLDSYLRSLTPDDFHVVETVRHLGLVSKALDLFPAID